MMSVASSIRPVSRHARRFATFLLCVLFAVETAVAQLRIEITEGMVAPTPIAIADFTGADRILKELADGPSRVRIGLIVKEGAPAREGAEIADADGNVIGKVTSGGPSPTLGKNIAMGFVPPAHAALGTELKVIVRGKPAAAEVVAMPFVAQRYYRKPKA